MCPAFNSACAGVQNPWRENNSDLEAPSLPSSPCPMEPLNAHNQIVHRRLGRTMVVRSIPQTLWTAGSTRHRYAECANFRTIGQFAATVSASVRYLIRSFAGSSSVLHLVNLALNAAWWVKVNLVHYHMKRDSCRYNLRNSSIDRITSLCGIGPSCPYISRYPAFNSLRIRRSVAITVSGLPTMRLSISISWS